MVTSFGPFFVLTIERKGCSTTLSVPSSFSPPTRRQRLVDWLKKEGWAVRGGAGTTVTGGAPAATEAAAHAAELLFVRDVLGPLRLRPGAVPEKAVARLLGVGVLALHRRCEALFAQRWSEFLLARWPEAPAPSPTPSPAPSSTPAPSITSLPVVAPAPPALPLVLLPPLALLPAASEAGEVCQEDSLVAFLLGCPAGSTCCGTPGCCHAACVGDNGEELESIFLMGGASDDLAAAAAAEAEWEAAVPPTPTPAPMPAAAAAQAQAPLFVPVPTVARPAVLPMAVAAQPTAVQRAAAAQPTAVQQAATVQPFAAAAFWAVLDLSADVPEAPPGFCPDLLGSAELDSAELAASDLDGAELLRDDVMWDLFPPTSLAPGL